MLTCGGLVSRGGTILTGSTRRTSMSCHRTLNNCPCRNKSNSVRTRFQFPIYSESTFEFWWRILTFYFFGCSFWLVDGVDITQHHMMHIRQAISESNMTKVEVANTHYQSVTIVYSHLGSLFSQLFPCLS